MTDSWIDNPDWLPFDIELSDGVIRLIQLSEAIYGVESFLDERVYPNRNQRIISFDSIDSAVSCDEKLNFIFHLGHVGSTLLSRVLGCGPSTFSVREPAILRRIANLVLESREPICAWPLARLEAGLDAGLRLLSRVYHPGQVSLVKTTSFVGEIAPLLMERASSARAVLLVAHPKIFIASILGGAASREELSRVSVGRIARLNRRCPRLKLDIDALSDGELAALGWVTELLGLAEAGRLFPDRTLWLDFDGFLQDRRSALNEILLHLTGAAGDLEVETMLESPDFAIYSKATDHGFDGSIRHRLIGDYFVTHAVEIERGLAWINAAANDELEIAAAGRAAAIAFQRHTATPR